jgi:hypothetical protein
VVHSHHTPSALPTVMRARRFYAIADKAFL